jgi:hypothetical protein
MRASGEGKREEPREGQDSNLNFRVLGSAGQILSALCLYA